jgi:hypothetical protein
MGHDLNVTISDISSRLGYAISGYLVIGDWLSFIDHHTWVVGAALGLLTWITNVCFRLIDRNAKAP